MPVNNSKLMHNKIDQIWLNFNYPLIYVQFKKFSFIVRKYLQSKNEPH